MSESSPFPPLPPLPPMCPVCGSAPMKPHLRSRDKQPIWTCSTTPICWGVIPNWNEGFRLGQHRADQEKLTGIAVNETSASAPDAVKLLKKLSKAGLLERQPKPRKSYGGLLEDGGLEWLEAVRPFDE